jgi:hypothetical protein
MKKMILPFLLFGFILTNISAQSGTMLAVGSKAPAWTFQDADKADFTMDSWAGKVIQVNYVDPDVSDLNDPFNDANQHGNRTDLSD